MKTVTELQGIDGMVLPGGESTSIALIGDRDGMLDALRKWVLEARPVWGTCAGCIMLANDVKGQKIGGYDFFAENPFSCLIRSIGKG